MIHREQTGVKSERTFLKFATVDFISGRPEIKDMLKFFNFRRILRQVYMGILRG